jgi:hypothetical protein
VVPLVRLVVTDQARTTGATQETQAERADFMVRYEALPAAGHQSTAPSAACAAEVYTALIACDRLLSSALTKPDDYGVCTTNDSSTRGKPDTMTLHEALDASPIHVAINTTGRENAPVRQYTNGTSAAFKQKSEGPG